MRVLMLGFVLACGGAVREDSGADAGDPCPSGCLTADGECMDPGWCHPHEAGQICDLDALEWVSTCPDGTCDCGEDTATCPADCSF